MSNTKKILSIVLICLLTITFAPMIPIGYAGAAPLTVNPPILPPGHGTHGLLDGNKDTPVLDANKAPADDLVADPVDTWWDCPALRSNGFYLMTAVNLWTFFAWGPQNGPFAPVVIAAPPAVTAPYYYLKFPAVFHDAKAGSAAAQPAHSFALDSRMQIVGATYVYGPIAEGANPAVGLDCPTHLYIVDPPDPAEMTPAPERAGPQFDVFEIDVIQGPDPTLIAMQNEWTHVATDLIRTGDIEKLDGDLFTIAQAEGFHMGHIGYNLRDDHAYRIDDRPDWGTFGTWPLADPDFRLALFKCYDQETIIAAIYGYTVGAVQSLVPPAQGGWQNPDVPKHPYNPGIMSFDPLDPNYMKLSFAPGTSTGILDAAGYDFIDDNLNGIADPEDYWEKPDGYAVPWMELFTPTYETAPTSAQHGARFVADLAEIGLASTESNGHSGFEHQPRDFSTYMDEVDYGLFDAYMVFWSLGRFPDHLYDMCHSSQDVQFRPKAYNYPGIRNDDIDDCVEIIKTSLNHTAKMIACYEVQELLYDPTVEDALGYMQLYSRIYFNGFNPNLRGVVNSPGYGADNGYTYLNLRWEEGSEIYVDYPNDNRTKLIWTWGEPPERLNPCYASTVYAWDIIDKTLDGFLGVNPYTHEDLDAMAEDWDTDNWAGQGVYHNETWMNITYWLRKDVFWQDGNPFTAEDAKFNWMFLKHNEIPRFTSTWQYIQKVEVIDDYTVKAILNTTSQFLLYDVAAVAAMLPPPVWEPWNMSDLELILGYDPSTDTTYKTGMGAWWGTPVGASTCLYGTGPWVFDYYDETGLAGELHQFPGYYDLTSDIETDLTEWFHGCGDVDRNGEVWTYDQSIIGIKFGLIKDIDPGYDEDVDVTGDGVIDVEDVSKVNFFYGDRKEWPAPA